MTPLRNFRRSVMTEALNRPQCAGPVWFGISRFTGRQRAFRSLVEGFFRTMTLEAQMVDGGLGAVFARISHLNLVYAREQLNAGSEDFSPAMVECHELFNAMLGAKVIGDEQSFDMLIAEAARLPKASQVFLLGTLDSIFKQRLDQLVNTGADPGALKALLIDQIVDSALK